MGATCSAPECLLTLSPCCLDEQEFAANEKVNKSTPKNENHTDNKFSEGRIPNESDGNNTIPNNNQISTGTNSYSPTQDATLHNLNSERTNSNLNSPKNKQDSPTSKNYSKRKSTRKQIIVTLRKSERNRKYGFTNVANQSHTALMVKDIHGDGLFLS